MCCSCHEHRQSPPEQHLVCVCACVVCTCHVSFNGSCVFHCHIDAALHACHSHTCAHARYAGGTVQWDKTTTSHKTRLNSDDGQAGLTNALKPHDVTERHAICVYETCLYMHVGYGFPLTHTGLAAILSITCSTVAGVYTHASVMVMPAMRDVHDTAL